MADVIVSDRHRWSLRHFSGQGYEKGRPLLVQAAWFCALNLVFVKWWCPARLRVVLLRSFGASVGERVYIRHGVRVHWPWKLDIDDDVWVGENAWLLNLERISIGKNCCLSQNVLLCTGGHQRFSATFEYANAPISLDANVWVAAGALILAGVHLERGSVVPAGRVLGPHKSGRSTLGSRGS